MKTTMVALRASAMALVTGLAVAAAPALAQRDLGAPQLLPEDIPVAPGQANLFFDYFLFDNVGTARNNIRGVSQLDTTGFFLWTVTNGSVDLVGDGLLTRPVGSPLPVNLEGRYVDLGGSTGAPGLLETFRPEAVRANTEYRLRFRYRGTDGQDDSATVRIGDATTGFTFNVASSTSAFQQFDQRFTFTDLQLLNLASLVRIGFQGDAADTDNTGIGIDSVLFDEILPVQVVDPANPGAVPEPATWALMLMGFGAVGWSARRRPRATVRFS